MTLRKYQVEAHDCAINFIKKSTETCIIEAETGSGKSHIIAAIADTFYRMSGKHVLCTAPNVDLVRQNTEKFLATGSKASIFSASIGKSLRHPVVFGTPITILNAIDKFSDKFGLIVIDECHGITESIKSIISSMREKNKMLRVIGLSATPYRLGSGLIYELDENDKPSPESSCVDPYFKKKVYTIGGRELIDMGFLTPPVIGAIHAGHYDTLNMRLNSMGKFYQEDIDRAYTGQNRKTSKIIADIIAQSRDRQGVMIFAATVEHGKECMESLPPELSRMIGGDINTGKNERKRLVQDFKSKKFRYLVSIGTMTTGVDFTHVDVIALMRATESIALLKQCIGRGLRLDDNKSDCLVLDFAENIERHCGNDQDLFSPKIEAYKNKKSSTQIIAECPLCATENTFSARKNDEGFGYDQYGYFTDLTGERIKTEYGDMPGHMGRRCYGQELVKGKFERCLYYWTHKTCETCGEKCDISARHCSNKHELIDPNRLLVVEYRPEKTDPYKLQTDEVLAWNCKKTKSRKGEDMLMINFITNVRKFVAFILVRRKEYNDLMIATSGGDIKPQSVTYKKDKDTNYYKILGYNKSKYE